MRPRPAFARVWRGVGALLVLLLAELPVAGSAQTSKPPRDITCYSDVFEPYVVNTGDAIRGIDVDAVTEAARRVGLTVHVKLLPWARLENEIQRGEAGSVDCAFAYTHMDARNAYMDYTTVPLKVSVVQFFARADRFPHYKGIADLIGATLGVRRGFKLPASLQDMVAHGLLQVEEVDREESNFQKLAKGRIDVALSNQDAGMALVRKPDMRGIVPLSPPLLTIPTYLVFTKAKHLRALVPLIDKGLREIQQDGTYKKIRGRYP